MSRFWEIVFFLPLLFRRHVCWSELKRSPSRELPLTARNTVFSHLKDFQKKVTVSHKMLIWDKKIIYFWIYHFCFSVNRNQQMQVVQAPMQGYPGEILSFLERWALENDVCRFCHI